MGLAATLSWGLAAIFLAVSFWFHRRRRVRRNLTAMSERPAGTRPSETLIFIEEDGVARELTESEKSYVDREFSPYDGARPYVKSRYDQRNGWGDLSGYLMRQQLPVGMAVASAPPDSPVTGGTPEAVAKSLRKLIERHTINKR